MLLTLVGGYGWGDGNDRKELEPQVQAVMRDGKTIILEVAPPKGEASRPLFQKYLANPDDWRFYRDRAAVAIPYSRLNPASQRQVLEAFFSQDYVDQAGWWHIAGEGGMDAAALFGLAEWLTGRGSNFTAIRTETGPVSPASKLAAGTRMLVPRDMLLPQMKSFSPKAPPLRPRVAGAGGADAGAPAEQTPAAAEAPEAEKKEENASDESSAPAESSEAANNTPSHRRAADADVLRYGEDKQGKYAEYVLQKGEALYTAVVVRFTDFGENAEIQQAIKDICKRTGIPNPSKVEAGERIRIPMEMLSDGYQPEGSEERREYEAVREEARRIQSSDGYGSKDLEGVVVVLDPGHGGRDQGASVPKLDLYEDEINYDIVCRMRKILERETRAKVYVTMLDSDQDYAPSTKRRFETDTDEMVLTTPRYHNDDAKVSVGLRWYLANDIYRREKAKGLKDDRKIIFVSVHCDSIYNETLRGTMVYIPGSSFRRESEHPSNPIFRQFEEVRRAPSSSCTDAQARRDEALSLNFAETLIGALRTHKPAIKVHDASDPIRNMIRQKGGRKYVPGVLRNCAIPTKVLVETANMTNPEDQRRMADPQWRDAFADALVEALRRHYN